MMIRAAIVLPLVVALVSSANPAPREGKFCPSDLRRLSVVADPADCARYFRCLDNKYYAMECGRGLRFNREESYCDYGEHVDCETGMALAFEYTTDRKLGL